MCCLSLCWQSRQVKIRLCDLYLRLYNMALVLSGVYYRWAFSAPKIFHGNEINNHGLRSDIQRCFDVCLSTFSLFSLYGLTWIAEYQLYQDLSTAFEINAIADSSLAPTLLYTGDDKIWPKRRVRCVCICDVFLINSRIHQVWGNLLMGKHLQIGSLPLTIGKPAPSKENFHLPCSNFYTIRKLLINLSAQ